MSVHFKRESSGDQTDRAGRDLSLWLDFKSLGMKEEQLKDLVENKAKLWLDSGAMFGPDGEGFERINIACPREILKQALTQLAESVHDR